MARAVVTDRGLVVAAPPADGALAIIDLAGDASSGPDVPGGARLRLTSDGRTLWADDAAAGLHRYEVDGATITLLSVLPHGAPEVVPCDDFWLGEGDRRIAESCQLIHSIQDDGQVSYGDVSDEDGDHWLAWTYSAEVDRFALVKSQSPSIAWLHDGRTTNSQGFVVFPVDEGGSVIEAGHVFFSASGARLVMVGTLDDQIGFGWTEVPSP